MMDVLGQEMGPLGELSPAWFRDLIPTWPLGQPKVMSWKDGVSPGEPRLVPLESRSPGALEPGALPTPLVQPRAEVIQEAGMDAASSQSWKFAISHPDFCLKVFQLLLGVVGLGDWVSPLPCAGRAGGPCALLYLTGALSALGGPDS